MIDIPLLGLARRVPAAPVKSRPRSLCKSLYYAKSLY